MAKSKKAVVAAHGATLGSGNVFADLGLPDAELQAVKARLVAMIADAIEKAGMTQAEAATIMGLSQPDVSKMLRGLFRPTSLERLIGCLTKLGREVEISVSRRAKPNAKSVQVKEYA